MRRNKNKNFKIRIIISPVKRHHLRSIYTPDLSMMVPGHVLTLWHNYLWVSDPPWQLGCQVVDRSKSEPSNFFVGDQRCKFGQQPLSDDTRSPQHIAYLHAQNFV